MKRRDFLKGMIALPAAAAVPALACDYTQPETPKVSTPEIPHIEGCAPNGPALDGKHYNCGVARVEVAGCKDGRSYDAGSENDDLITAIKQCAEILDAMDVPREGRFIRSYPLATAAEDYVIMYQMQDHTGIPFMIGDTFTTDGKDSWIAVAYLDDDYEQLLAMDNSPAWHLKEAIDRDILHGIIGKSEGFEVLS